MIIDTLNNISLYSSLNNRIAKALEYLKGTDFQNTPDGRYDIDGTNIYASVTRYKTKTADLGKWEAHKNYIDVQFVAAGKEKIGYSFLKDMTPATEYNPEKDFMLLNGSGQFAPAFKDTFLILFPTDAHMPGICIDEPEDVIKVVVKVKINNP